MASRHSGYLWSSVLVPITKDRVVLPTTILMYFALVRGRVFDSDDVRRQSRAVNQRGRLSR